MNKTFCNYCFSRLAFGRLTLAVFLCCSMACMGYDFNIISNIDEKLNIPVEEYKKAGVQTVWFYSDYSQILTIDKDGKITWKSDEIEKKIKGHYEKFQNVEIKVIIIPGLWHVVFDSDKKLLCLDRWGKTSEFRCFAGDTGNIEKSIRFLVLELSQFPNFGGICLDDESAVMAGGAMNQDMFSGFEKKEKKYAQKVPHVSAYSGTPHGIINDKNPVLLWNRYQHECMLNFYLKAAKSAEEAMPGCPVYIIPANSWICGKTISIPNSPPEKTKTYILGQMDTSELSYFHLYVQYSIHAIDSNGWNKRIAAGQCQMQFVPPNCPRTVIPIYEENAAGKGISVTAFRRYLLQTFAEGAPGIGYWPIGAFTPEHFKAAAELNESYVKPFCERTGDLKKLPGKVAVLFSNSTSCFADIWKENPIERFKHNHQCDALAYFLLKKGIPFDIVLEDDVSDAVKKKDYKLIISSGVNYMTESCVAALREYISNGGKVIFDDKTDVKIDGVSYVPFNVAYWYKTLKGQYQRASDMEFQAGLLENALSAYLLDSFTVCKASSRHLNVNYMTDGKNIYVLIVNDDLSGEIKANIEFNEKYKIYDVLNDKYLSEQPEFFLNITIAKGSMLALRLER